MAGKMRKMKGRIEEAAGAILGNDHLKNVGRIDQAAGEMQQAVSKAKRITNKSIGRAARALKREDKLNPDRLP